MKGARVIGVCIACVIVWTHSVDYGALAQANKGCTIDTASPVAFGNYDAASINPVDVQGQITYHCSSGVVGQSLPRNGLTVQISISPGASGTFDRRMQGPRDVLRYNLYLDATRDVVWGDGTGGTQVFSSVAQPNDHPVTVPVFGRLFPGQDVGTGSYVDNLVVTLNF